MNPLTGHSAFYDDLSTLKDRFAAMQPELEVTVRDPALDVEGYVVVWNTGISRGGPLSGCGKGGTRIMPALSLDEVKMLARTMALKNAAAGLPLGGAKSGMRGDPDAPGFEDRYKRFVTLCKPFLYEHGGPFGGFGFDIGGRPQQAVWACEALGSTRSFTGKPVDMGGTDYDRQGIAGFGVAVAARALADHSPGKRFAVQGLGAMGAAVLHYYSRFGGVLCAVGDPRYGGTWRFDAKPSAALIDALFAQDQALVKQSLTAEARHVSDDSGAVLYEDADLLFPCAVHDVITGDNVAKIRVRAVVEGANGPCTPEARTMMFKSGITVLPDFIANAGGIIAAFVEMTSDAADKAEAAKALTETRIAENVRAMLNIAARENVPPCDAGLYLALSRMFGKTL